MKDKEFYRQNGKIAGSVKSPKKANSSRNNLAKANAKKAEIFRRYKADNAASE